jgi:hypothetical protein
MRASRVMCALAVASGVLVIPKTASAQGPDVNAQQLKQEIDQLRKDFETRMAALEARLAAVEGARAAAPAAAATEPPNAPPGAPQPPATPPPAEATPTAQVPAGAAGAGGPTGALPVYGASISGAKVFNPDIAVIGDFLGAAGRNAVNPLPALEMHESEAAFQAVVDPYARADFFISFGEQGVSVEEGFITLTELPGGLLTKVGKMRAAFGKVNGLHNHVLPWTDRPLVIQNLVAGEDGINDAGVSVARLIPNPWIFLEATGQVFRGDSGASLYKTSERGDLSYVGHVRAYQDLSESTNIDLGASYSRGHNPSGINADGADIGRFTTSLQGIDATLRWRPLARSIYHSFVGRTEVIWSRRHQPDGLQSGIGYYVSGDYQFARRWFAGLRFDRSAHADDAALIDWGQSAIVTYWPSEFSQVRGQYRRTSYAVGPTANEFLFQFQFSIGAHGAHPF